MGGPQAMATTDLVPPAQLIVDNKIGATQMSALTDEFCRIGEGMTATMIRSGFMKPGHKVLDVGCGLGRLARPLVNYFDGGEYFGVDINRSSIEWCQKAYEGHTNFHFSHADVFSTTYNETAKVKAEDYVFPFGDNSFDFVWSTSLFTHMLHHQIDRYLGEMARVMKSGAHCWNTYLLLDDEALDRVKRLKTQAGVKLAFEVEGGRVRDRNEPESQSAVYQQNVLDSHAKHGLTVVDIRYGQWSGRTENVRSGRQDTVIARK
jgi:SAM-dependent methyltransferase